MNARTIIENDELKGELIGGRDHWVICNKLGGMIYMATHPNGELYWAGKPEKAGTFSEAEAHRIAQQVGHIRGMPVQAVPAPE